MGRRIDNSRVFKGCAWSSRQDCASRQYSRASFENGAKEAGLQRDGEIVDGSPAVAGPYGTGSTSEQKEESLVSPLQFGSMLVLGKPSSWLLAQKR